MKNEYTVTTSEAIKVTITISRKQLWENYVSCWSDIAWDDQLDFSLNTLREVANVLLGEDMIKDQLKFRELFRDGHTMLLVGLAMKELDMRGNILREIVIQELDDFTGDVESKIVISHEDINF